MGFIKVGGLGDWRHIGEMCHDFRSRTRSTTVLYCHVVEYERKRLSHTLLYPTSRRVWKEATVMTACLSDDAMRNIIRPNGARNRQVITAESTTRYTPCDNDTSQLVSLHVAYQKGEEGLANAAKDSPVRSFITSARLSLLSLAQWCQSPKP